MMNNYWEESFAAGRRFSGRIRIAKRSSVRTASHERPRWATGNQAPTMSGLGACRQLGVLRRRKEGVIQMVIYVTCVRFRLEGIAFAIVFVLSFLGKIP